MLAGISITSNAQTLLYQWAFTNVSNTATTAAPTFAISPGTGNLIIQTCGGGPLVQTTTYFTNANSGPGSGPGINAAGALSANGSANRSGGTSVVAIATNLNLGNLSKFTVTFWVRSDPADGGTATLPRFVQFGASPTYDAGGKGSGNINGIGTSLNTANSLEAVQNGVAGTGGALNNVLSVTNTFPSGFPQDDTTWVFEALTYDGTLTTSNFTTWIGSTGISVTSDAGPQPANFGLVNFTTNATVEIGGDNSSSAPRSITTGLISDVRFYSGICSSNVLEQIRQFQVPSLIPPNPLPPTVVVQPGSGSTFVKGSRTFSVVADGNPATFTYLWRSNGVAIGGATNSSVTLTNIQLSANGATFVCSVTNIVGGTNSLPATITVLTPTPGSYAQAMMTNNPYSFWLVNEPSNSTPVTISDYANGNDGQAATPSGSLFLSGVSSPGYPGFPANNTSIETVQGRASQLNTPALPLYTDSGMTICGWVYTPTTGTSGDGLIFNLPSDTSSGYGLVFGSGNELDYQWGNGAASSPSGLIIPSAEWTFVALVISTNLTQQDITNSITSDTNATLYVGSPSGGFTSKTYSTAFTGDTFINNNSSVAPLVLGRTTISASENGAWYATSTVQFNDVAVLYSALSSQTISNIYTVSVPPPQNDTWVGNISSDWDAIYEPGTTNWTSGGVPVAFSSGDFVLFDDTADTGSANVVGNLSPGSVTVSNNMLPYVIGGDSISGNATLTKQGTNVLTLSSPNTYSGLTTVANGTLLVNYSISSGVNIIGGTLGGDYGTIGGEVTNMSGGTLAPGATIGSAGVALSMSGDLTLLSGSANIFLVSKDNNNNDNVNVSGTVTYGGRLTILTNVTDTIPLALGDSYTLFSAGAYTGNFSSIQPPPGPGLAWSNDSVNLGQFDVVAASAVTVPVAGFNGAPTNIFVTQSVLFTDASTPTDGSITNWVWNFGDGTSVTNASGVSVNHSYAVAGTYTVSLIVTSAGGSGTNTQSGYMVKPKPAISKTALSGGSLALGGTNGPAGVQYRILSSTNVALPLINWIPVWTNVVAPDGSYGYTNSALTNKASFFLLVSP